MEEPGRKAGEKVRIESGHGGWGAGGGGDAQSQKLLRMGAEQDGQEGWVRIRKVEAAGDF